VSNYVGPELTDILAALASISAMVILMKFWSPRQIFRLAGDEAPKNHHAGRSSGQVFFAWVPYLFLVVFVLVWGYPAVNRFLSQVTMPVQVPGLHNLVQRIPPATAQAAPYAAVFN